MRLMVLSLAFGLVLAACHQDEPEGEAAAAVAPVAPARIDKRARAGRVFMYLDDSGSVVRTASFDEIPAAKRSAVMVIEGRQRSRARPKPGGGVQIEALPPLVAPGPAGPTDAEAGAADAEALLAAHPPEGGGPPSTERWTDEQWRDEVKRELEELRKEQEQDPAK